MDRKAAQKVTEKVALELVREFIASVPDDRISNVKDILSAIRGPDVLDCSKGETTALIRAEIFSLRQQKLCGFSPIVTTQKAEVLALLDTGWNGYSLQHFICHIVAAARAIEHSKTAIKARKEAARDAGRISSKKNKS